jgi:amidase
VSSTGHIPGPPGTLANETDLGVSGPLGRSAGDCALALDVMSRGGFMGMPGASLPPASPRALTPRALRVGLWLDDAACPVSKEVGGLLGFVATALAEAGVTLVEETRTPTPLATTHELYEQLLYAALAPGLPERFVESMRTQAQGDPEDPAVRRASRYVQSHTSWLAADEQRHRLRREWAAVFTNVDVVLAPISPIPAFPHDTDTPFQQRVLEVDGDTRSYGSTMLVWPGLATLPGLPATAVPVGRTTDGLPVGVQVVGPMFGDHTCLAVAGLLEGLLGGFVAPPGPA